MASLQKKYPDFYTIMKNEEALRMFSKDVHNQYKKEIDPSTLILKQMIISSTVMDVLPTMDISKFKNSISLNELPFDSAHIILGASQKDGLAVVVKVPISDKQVRLIFYILKGQGQKEMKSSVFQAECIADDSGIKLRTEGKGDRDLNTEEKLLSERIVALFIYMLYGDIETKTYKPNEELKTGPFTLKNTLPTGIVYVNTLWKQRVCTTGFKVRGHWRLQPFGIGMKTKRLIWIEAFSKNGYNRKATKELI